MSTSSVKSATHLATRLTKEVIHHPGKPAPDACFDLLALLEELKISIALLDESKIGKLLAKSVKAFKRHKRTEADQDEDWQGLVDASNKLLGEWKATADKEAKKNARSQAKKGDDGSKQRMGLPKTTPEYRVRLVTQKKELYKDPPVLPPPPIGIESKTCPPPKRNKSTGELTFAKGEDSSIQSLLKDFHPNRTPEEVLRAGSFGGTYFRPITSAVTNVRYNPQAVLKDTVRKEWIEGVPMSNLTSVSYRAAINKYGVKCGGSLGMWESSGWIVDCDPYGWFQWYCRFYQGRRCSDDARQISRWCKSAGPKGRFRSQLCNKILAAGTTYDDRKISPVIRQTLLHWGLEITPNVLEKHRKRTGK